jgi:hypothetical protein
LRCKGGRWLCTWFDFSSGSVGFLAEPHSASLTALQCTRVASANDRIGVAVAGCGMRGLLGEVSQYSKESNVEVTGLCDIWKQQRESAAEKVKKPAPIETAYGHSVACIMADESFERGRRMVHDPARRVIHEG